MENKRIIIWTTEVLRLIEGKPIGGIAVQMFYWAQIFVNNQWSVFSFTDYLSSPCEKEGVLFRSIKRVRGFNLLLEWWYAFYYLYVIRPTVVIFRGADRSLLPLTIACKLFKVKLVFFGASDVNFEPGHELLRNNFNRYLFQLAVRNNKYFVVQNQHQHDTLLNNYGKKSIVLFNIGGCFKLNNTQEEISSDAIWVANFRRLKRAEWVINAAKHNPSFDFLLVGARSGDGSYYDYIEKQSNELVNISFLGAQSFYRSNSLVARAKVLLCTSTFEGFPNTFIQAWSFGIPVISTVDPSGVIKRNNLGVVVNTEEEFNEALQLVLSNKEYYYNLCRSIKCYFEDNHAPQNGFNKFLSYIS